MIILVTGKSGSGKSTFAKTLASSLGYKYIDIDAIGHSLYQDEHIIAHVRKLFGEEIFDEDGSFNRKKLGNIIFREKTSSRVQEFNTYTWHEMEAKLDILISTYKNVILDWILLPNTKYWSTLAYKILVKSSNDSTRFEKLVLRDNVKIDYLKLREKSSIDYCEAEFNYILNNDYDLDNLNSHTAIISKDIDNLIKVKPLGTMSPFALDSSACPSYHLSNGDDDILIDCGSGSHRFFDMKKLDNLNISISHLHRDHYNDIFNYMYTAYCMKNQNRITKPLSIYLPSTPTHIVDDIKSEKLTFSNISTFDETSKFQIGQFKIDFLKVEHSLDMECFAMRVTLGSKIIVYTGDISFTNRDRLIQFAKNADLLISEASLLREHNMPDINSHITAHQASLIAKEAGVKKLAITHFWPEASSDKYLEEATNIFKNTIILKENKEFYI